MKKLLIILSLFLLIGSCKDDCPEPDPCDAYPERFEIENFVYNYLATQDINKHPTTAHPYDVFNSSDQTYFKLNYDYDSVKWVVGLDPRIRTNKTLSVYFVDQEEDVQLTAIGYRTPSSECFGEGDDGIDTIQKTLNFVEYFSAPITGIFRGTSTGDTDSFDIKIDIYKDSDSLRHFGITNLPDGGTETLTIGHSWLIIYGGDHPALVNKDGVTHHYTIGKIYGDNYDRIEIGWRLFGDNQNRIFRGRKL